MQKSSRPSSIGIFDSGVGGLSVLRALLKEMHDTNFIYIADLGFGPYGEQSSAYVVERSQHLTQFLLQTSDLDQIVLACNTATAAAAKALRGSYPEFSFVGIEPAIKPAAQQSKSGNIGVMATASTLNSATFSTLRAQLEAQYPRVCFETVACVGLAKAIEDGFLSGNALEAQALAKKYLMQLPELDTLVLGCTHYPFLTAFLQEAVGPQVRIVEPSVPVALQSKRVMSEVLGRRSSHAFREHPQAVEQLPYTQLQTSTAQVENGNSCMFFSTSQQDQDIALLQAACSQWLGVQVSRPSAQQWSSGVYSEYGVGVAEPFFNPTFA